MNLKLLIMALCISDFANCQIFHKGDSLYDVGQFIDARAEYERIPKLGISLTHIDSGNLFNRTGMCEFELGNSIQAIQNYFRALEIFQRHQIGERQAAINTNIARVYFSLNDHENHLKYRLASLNLYKKINDSFRIASVLNDAAIAYYKLQNYNAAIALHSEALTNYTSVLNDDLWQKHLFNKGNCLENVNKDSALKHFNMALAIAERTANHAMISAIYNSIADIHKLNGDYAQASKFLERSLEINTQYGSKQARAIILGNLAEVYELNGEFEKAYSQLKQARSLDAHLYEIGNAKTASELGVKYETEKKEETIRIQTLENNLKSRNLFLSLLGLALAATLAVVGFISYHRKQVANKLLVQQKARIESLNHDLSMSNQVKTKLFSIISHDIRSPIGSLYAYLQLKQLKADSADSSVTAQLEELLNTLEDMLIWSKSQLQQFVLIGERIELASMITQTIALLNSSVRQAGVKIVQSIPDNTTINSDQNILQIIVRNLLSNSIKYALPGTDILINADQYQDSITLRIANEAGTRDIIAFETPSLLTSDKSGLGRILVDELVQKINGSICYEVSSHLVTAILVLRNL